MENDRFQDLVLEHLARLTQEMTGVKQGQQELTNKVDKLEARFENEVIDKIKTLFEARWADREILERVEKRVDAIFEQVAVHEVQIKVIKKAAD
jgi:response regulator RpfG family c-di-GMP phosphodiesterase